MPVLMPSSPPSSPASHCCTCSVVMPYSIIVNGSVIWAGGVFRAGWGRRVDRASMMPRRCSISAGQ